LYNSYLSSENVAGNPHSLVAALQPQHGVWVAQAGVRSGEGARPSLRSWRKRDSWMR